MRYNNVHRRPAAGRWSATAILAVAAPLAMALLAPAAMAATSSTGTSSASLTWIGQ